jgi:polar amino acid transport system substrate-binding protein
MPTRMSTRVSSAAALAASALLLAACGSSSNNTTTTGGGGSGGTSATKVDSIAREVPSAIASKGTLTIAADASYPPNEFFDTDNKTVIGMDADLGKAIAQVMGLTPNVVNATFDSILPGLTAGKYDLGMSSFTDTKEREKTVDFVTYFSAGTSFFIKATGPDISSLDDLCGHHVSVEKGTTQQDDATAQDGKCKSAGKPGVDVQIFPDQNGANLALSSGRAEVSMADSPVAEYQVKQSSGQFKVSGKPYGTAPYGIAMNKGTGMSKAVLDALQELMKDGVYKNILDKWGIAGGAISNPQVNGAQS